ncbi:MAG: hypothetical protein M1118_06195 [Chloroflexi bacterium]|nr:hypothetical protein [Chloroflexota bacterium]
MKHLGDSELRRVRDEPQLVSRQAREHVEECGVCQMRLEVARQDATLVGRCLDLPDYSPNAPVALLRFNARLAREQQLSAQHLEKGFLSPMRQQLARLQKPLVGIATAGTIAAALALTPAGALAQSFLTLFQPTHVVAVPITSGELQTLSSLQELGTLSVTKSGSPVSYPSAAAASAAAGLPVPQLGALPSGVPTTAKYEVIPGQSATFTFSAAKAAATAKAAGQQLPLLPANLDGATLRFSTNATFAEIFGNFSQLENQKATQGDGKVPSAAQLVSSTGPFLIVGESRAPTLTATGANVTVAELENYVLSVPGVSPELKQTIRSLGDPATTLPLPIPVNKAVAENVTLNDGTQAVVVGDSTGVAGFAVFVRNGIVYGIGGSFTKDQVIALANSLH